MFFRKKRRDEDEIGTETASGLNADAVEGSMPGAAEVTPSLDAEMTASLSPSVPAVPEDADAVRLFPGFEHEDFEVGFRMGGEAPALVMRWKDGGEWFRMPPMFNRAVLASMDERDSASDLTRLMRSFGYDVA